MAAFQAKVDKLGEGDNPVVAAFFAYLVAKLSE